MTIKTKGRSGGDRPTRKTSSEHYPNPIRAAIKVAIVRSALRGVIPANVATWLIQHAGLKNA